jgi:hypothetical protein
MLDGLVYHVVKQTGSCKHLGFGNNCNSQHIDIKIVTTCFENEPVGRGIYIYLQTACIFQPLSIYYWNCFQ